MTDPFLDSLATALAGQAAGVLGSAGSTALEKVRGLIRGRSEQDPEMGAALEAAEQPAAEEPTVRALAERLDRAATQDPEFAQQLRSDGAEVHREVTASEQSVVNTVSGNADKVIQAREIHGGITFN
ncbi:hypothetical protein [Parasphingorhabdus pacifica]